MKIALAQINPTVGDFNGNLEKIIAATRRAAEQGARLAVFSELAICGYPPEDLLLRPGFLRDCRRELEGLASATTGSASLKEHVMRHAVADDGPPTGPAPVHRATLPPGRNRLHRP